MSDKPDFSDWLGRNPCPHAGSGVHSWVMSAANVAALKGVDSNEAVDVITAGMARKPKPGTEVVDACRKAFAEKGSGWREYDGIIPRAAPAWPPRNEETIRSAVDLDFTSHDLWEASPIHMLDADPLTEDVIDALFPGDPLLCCGWASDRFDTRTREEWRGELSAMQLIVPSAMTARTGLTKDGKVSAHTLANTGRKMFQVLEFDHGDADEQAAILWHIQHAFDRPLVLAVHSGNKSIHGWFRAGGMHGRPLRRFMRYAAALGADKATWTPSQFVRMPDGLRPPKKAGGNATRQSVVYYDPFSK